MTPRSSRAGRQRRSCWSVGVAAGPDQAVAVLAFGVDQRGEDRRREARVVELDREVVAALAFEVFFQAAPNSVVPAKMR